jgi:hypothetical protein
VIRNLIRQSQGLDGPHAVELKVEAVADDEEA